MTARRGASWQTANDLFHEVIQDVSCNRVRRETIASLHRSFPRNLTWGRLDDLRLLQDNVIRRRAILEAVEDHDGAKARRLLVARITRSGELIATPWPTLSMTPVSLSSLVSAMTRGGRLRVDGQRSPNDPPNG